jgi:ketosteroid isomerase-like protein
VDLAALEKYDKLWLHAINNGDIEALSALTAAEHITFPSGRPPVVGRAANDAVNALTFDQYRVNEHWYPDETVVFGDFAFERGAFTSDATPKAGGETVRFSGNYLRILRRQPDGGWKMIREMASSDRP